METIKQRRHIIRIACLVFTMVMGCIISVSAQSVCFAPKVCAQENVTEEASAKDTVLNYRVKQQTGWGNYYSSGATAENADSAKSITNIDISVTSSLTGTVQFMVYTSSGWSAYTTSEDTSVTAGKIQAIKVSLTDELASCYDIYYRVHITDGQWLDWASNARAAGSKGIGLRINAIQVTLVSKGAQAPGSTAAPCIVKPTLTYRSAFCEKEYSAYKAEGKTSGSKKNKTCITAISLKLENKMLSGGIKYRVAGETTGYGDWSAAGKTAGNTMCTECLTKMQIKLTGQLATAYDIYYRVKIQNYGWLDWAKNGAAAGSSGLGLNITAYQVKLVKKGKTVSFSTKDAYLISDQQEYVIKVNKEKNCVTVYLNNKPIKAFICSTGKSTPTGTFYTITKYRWRSLFHNVWGQYSTRIVNHILFHSVPYTKCSNRALDVSAYRKLGTTASDGCIRLTCRDAKWIYDNCKLKTKVVIYKSKDPGPLGKPEAPYLPEDQTWDPTDPAFS